MNNEVVIFSLEAVDGPMVARILVRVICGILFYPYC